MFNDLAHQPDYTGMKFPSATGRSDHSVPNGLPPIQWKHKSQPYIAGQRARDAGRALDDRDDRYLPGTEERYDFAKGWAERDQIIRDTAPDESVPPIAAPLYTPECRHTLGDASCSYDAVQPDDLYAPLIAPPLPEALNPAAAELPANLPPYDYEVKSWPAFFSAMISGKKTHDFRDMRDRKYAVGDRMLLREYDPFGGGYTGRVAQAYITYITSKVTPCAMSSAVLDPNFCVLSVRVSGVYPDDDRNA